MTTPRLTIVRDPADPVAGTPPVAWAVDRLRHVWTQRGGGARLTDRPDEAADYVLHLPGSVATHSSVTMPESPEAFVLEPGVSDGGALLIARGSDVRGTTYAVLELADRVEHAAEPFGTLRLAAPDVGRPANAMRSVTRLFCSEVEDLGWFRDEAFWHRYLSMLVSQRFNRFSLTLGLGYNYHRDVSDAYLYFAYPFLVSVPGYDVRVPQLAEEERERNLAMLRFISEQAVARGLEFQLGLWTHAYAWIDSPNAHHTVEGLTPETHAPYCRDAVRTLLDACPSIGGVTFRVHGESGVPEGSWEFWRSVFEGVASCGRRVGIDLHAKGLDARTLGSALDTGLPITVSTKFWAEHMGLPYHQAAIRESERLPRGDPSDLSEWHRSMRVSEGSRPFTRYGYGDFLREDRPYDVVFRLWAGTQRVLLWGDPAFASGYGRAASLAGAQGLEWCEPLTFKGREGSGIPGSRTGYADPSLDPEDDWEKFAYTYRLFGRLTYDPNASAEVWRRPLRAHFGPSAPDAESALASASRILPLVTVAHHPSASNNYYWPEMYTDMPIVWSEEGTRPHPYHDTPEPWRFGTVGPLDPEVFSSVVSYVDERVRDAPSGRVSPLEVAGWLDRLARDAGRHLATVIEGVRRPDAEVRRWSADIAILAALGRFFAGKLRAAVDYELHTETGDREALRRAVDAYRDASQAWRDASALAEGIYLPDLTYGPQRRIRGHWSDRLPAIEADLRDMEDRLRATGMEPVAGHVRHLPVDAPGAHRGVEVVHVPPSSFTPGADLALEVELLSPNGGAVQDVSVRYRPMNQALAFEAAPMERSGDRAAARIAADRLDGAYPVAYAFVLRGERGAAWRYPALGGSLSSQPYFVIRPERVGTTDDHEEAR